MIFKLPCSGRESAAPPPRVPEAITKAVEKSLEGIVTGNVPDP